MKLSELLCSNVPLRLKLLAHLPPCTLA